MKNTNTLTALLAIIAAGAITTSHAQNAGEPVKSGTTTVQAAVVSPVQQGVEDQIKLQAAFAKIQNDPEFLKARDAFLETQRRLFIKADPSITPILDKIDAARKAQEAAHSVAPAAVPAK